MGFLRAFCCWQYKEILGGWPTALLSLLPRDLYVQRPKLGCHCYYPACPSVLEVKCPWPKEISVLITLVCRGGGRCLGIWQLPLQNLPGPPQTTKLGSYQEIKTFPVIIIPTDFQNSNWIMGPVWLIGVYTIVLFSFHYSLSRVQSPQEVPASWVNYSISFLPLWSVPVVQARRAGFVTRPGHESQRHFTSCNTWGNLLNLCEASSYDYYKVWIQIKYVKSPSIVSGP